MAEITDVVPGQEVLADWGNLVRDRSTMRYTSIAALEASEPSAVNGSVRWADDVGLVLRKDGAWVPVVLDDALVTLSGGHLVVGSEGSSARIDMTRGAAINDWRWAIGSDGVLLLQRDDNNDGAFQTLYEFGSDLDQALPLRDGNTGTSTIQTSGKVVTVTMEVNEVTWDRDFADIPAPFIPDREYWANAVLFTSGGTAIEGNRVIRFLNTGRIFDAGGTVIPVGGTVRLTFTYVAAGA